MQPRGCASAEKSAAVARRVDAAERLAAALSELVAVYSDMRELVEVSRTRAWTSAELSRYLQLRRLQGRLSRSCTVALTRHDRARHRAWIQTRDEG